METVEWRIVDLRLIMATSVVYFTVAFLSLLSEIFYGNMWFERWCLNRTVYSRLYYLDNGPYRVRGTSWFYLVNCLVTVTRKGVYHFVPRLCRYAFCSWSSSPWEAYRWLAAINLVWINGQNVVIPETNYSRSWSLVIYSSFVLALVQTVYVLSVYNKRDRNNRITVFFPLALVVFLHHRFYYSVTVTVINTTIFFNVALKYLLVTYWS